jgi:hypothetical protein
VSVVDETLAYAAYLNASFTERYEDDQDRQHFAEDMVKAKAAMETAWLEQKPTTDDR